jgi:hypothetical protein
MSKDSTSLYFIAMLFHLLFPLFLPVLVCFASDINVSLICGKSEKTPFFRCEAKNISLSFRFVSLEAKINGAPYEQPNFH